MPESDEFWDFYWDVRLQELEDLGKREAILAVSKLIRALAEQPEQPVRLLELGCGEGQVIGALVEAHALVNSIDVSCGVDFSHRAIKECRRRYPQISFIEGDFTDQEMMSGLGRFEIVLLVNALHEVFSAGYTPENGEVILPEARRRVEQALKGAVERLTPGGYLALFDGLESSGDIQQWIRIRFHHWPARRRFEAFAHEYRPFRITYRESGDPFGVELSFRDFTRYVTKSIFLEKRLWQTERLESYQYFNEAEFREAFARQGLTICELRTLTVNYGKWRSEVEIETAGVDFPEEHILILARAPLSGLKPG
jgi:SAM-dependent methyltransferase